MDRDFCNLTEEQIVIFDDIATRDFYNQDYNNLRSDQKFQMFASMISDDPADHLNPIFEDLLESYVKLKTAINADKVWIDTFSCWEVGHGLVLLDDWKPNALQ